jgi:hypothetical protein
MIMGQIEQMKMVQMAAGLALEHQQADRQPGQRRHRAQQADQRVEHAREEGKASDHKARRDTNQSGQAKSHSHPFKRGMSTFHPTPWSLGPFR